MKIAVMADGCDGNSKVAEKFADARWLLIADMDGQCISEVIEKSKEDIENTELAKIIVDRDCELVICGEIEKIPFEILADRQVTRALGKGLTVTDALNYESMLEPITDCIGGTGCPGEANSKDIESCCGEHV
ncbi:Dinitrogenase iron-molybdenum cofactor [Pelotomaculum schinkii]|uniref:Dinitrogenase iron-molybdenum cofactor n=1 Tax=Pelotomaculum schinkii TaxID=78350 RepID=A0A4Y7R731_9FIRM|nr:NifB/NifX family molybdenum-iron cluster-binding protein [Pelotomaculum schinkii]TEB04430.1 Dinitrogenase iron-molybdenum cofactor [Pelotomaculum schinkii]